VLLCTKKYTLILFPDTLNTGTIAQQNGFTILKRNPGKELIVRFQMQRKMSIKPCTISLSWLSCPLRKVTLCTTANHGMYWKDIIVTNISCFVCSRWEIDKDWALKYSRDHLSYGIIVLLCQTINPYKKLLLHKCVFNSAFSWHLLFLTKSVEGATCPEVYLGDYTLLQPDKYRSKLIHRVVENKVLLFWTLVLRWSNMLHITPTKD